MLRALTPTAALFIALCCPSATGCSGSSKGGENAAASAHGEDTQPFRAPGEFDGQVPSMVGSKFVDLLPESTLAAAVLKNPLGLAQKLGLQGLLGEYGKAYQDIEAKLRTSEGFVFPKPSTWHSIGIDAKSELGVAFVSSLLRDADGQLRISAFFVLSITLGDAALFEGSVPNLAQTFRWGQSQKTQVPGATVFRFREASGQALVIRDGQALLLIPDREGDSERMLSAMTAARGSELRETGRVKKMFEGVGLGEELSGFVALDTMASLIVADKSHRNGSSWAGDEVERLERELSLLPDDAAPALREERTNMLRKAIKTFQRESMRTDTELRFLKEVLAAMGTLSIGVDIEGKSTRLRMRLQTKKNSIPDRILAKGPGRGDFAERMERQPVLGIGARTDPTALLELFQLILQMDGHTSKEFDAFLLETYGFHLAGLQGALGRDLGASMGLTAAYAHKAKAVQDLASVLGASFWAIGEEDAQDALLAEIKKTKPLKSSSQGSTEPVFSFPSFNSRRLNLRRDEDALSLASEGTLMGLDASSAEAPLLKGHPSALAVFDPLALIWLVFSSYEHHAPREAVALGDESQERRMAQRAQESWRRIEEARASLGRVLGVLYREDSAIEGIAIIHGRAKNLLYGLRDGVEAFEPELERIRIRESQ